MLRSISVIDAQLQLGSAGNVSTWYDHDIGYRFYCSPARDSIRELEALRSHVALLLRAQRRLEATPAAEPLVIEVSNDDAGVRYCLDASSRERLLRCDPDATPAALGVFFENRDAIVSLLGEDIYRTEVAMSVTGLNEDELAAMGGVIFRDPDRLLTELEPMVVAKGGLAGQLDGDWYGPNEIVPSNPPGWDPTAAILPNKDHALVLVPVEFRWHPMSDSAIDTHRHTIGMRNGETWTFLARSPAREFSAQLAESLPTIGDVAKVYGTDAASRARPDRPVVQVRIIRK